MTSSCFAEVEIELLSVNKVEVFTKIEIKLLAVFKSQLLENFADDQQKIHLKRNFKTYLLEYVNRKRKQNKDSA